MAERPHFERPQPGSPQPPNDVSSQWHPNLAEQEGPDPASDSYGIGQLQTAQANPIVPSLAQQRTSDQLPDVTNPRDLYLPEEQAGDPSQLYELNSSLDTISPGQIPKDRLPGMLFGVDFQWDFNPMSDYAANIWPQMPAHSWLDTADGWNAMLRPSSPSPTEGNLSVDSHATHYIPKTPSVLSLNDDEYVEMDGRKYHRYHAGRYLLPNDELEQDRLDLQHAAWTMLFHGELSLAPIGEPKRTLDIATGTGIWAIQFAEKHPNTTVIGTDLSPIQPDAKPENCRFWVEDAEDPWHHELPFDYVHARLVCSCFDDPRKVIRQAYDNLEPGGWIEFQDGDCTVHCDDDTLTDTALKHILELFDQSAMCLGRAVRVAEYYKDWIIEAGFEEVTERKFKLPGNTWPKDPYAKMVGKYEGANVKDGLDGLSRAVMRGCPSLTETERAALTEQAKFDCCNPDIHWYVKVFVVYGRKPYAPSMAPVTAATTLAGVGTFC